MPVDQSTTNSEAGFSFSGHRCSRCNKIFPKRPWLEHHQTSCRPSNSQNNSGVKEATKSKTVEVYYRCPKCPHMFNSYLTFKQHLFVVHQLDEPSNYVTQRIDRSKGGQSKTSSKSTCRKGFRVSCPFCHKSNHKYKSLWHLQKHMGSKHKRTASSTSIPRHAHDHPYSCPLACKQTSELLVEHNLLLGETPEENLTTDLPPLQQISKTSEERTPSLTNRPEDMLTTDFLQLQQSSKPSEERTALEVEQSEENLTRDEPQPLQEIAKTPEKRTLLNESSVESALRDPVALLRCPLCADGSPTFKDCHELSIHSLNKHSPKVLLTKCQSEASGQLDTPKRLKLYLWKCMTCAVDGYDQIFRSNKDLNNHITTHHNQSCSKNATPSQIHLENTTAAESASHDRSKDELQDISRHGNVTFQIRISLSEDEKAIQELPDVTSSGAHLDGNSQIGQLLQKKVKSDLNDDDDDDDQCRQSKFVDDHHQRSADVSDQVSQAHQNHFALDTTISRSERPDTEMKIDSQSNDHENRDEGDIGNLENQELDRSQYTTSEDVAEKDDMHSNEDEMPDSPPEINLYSTTENQESARHDTEQGMTTETVLSYSSHAETGTRKQATELMFDQMMDAEKRAPSTCSTAGRSFKSKTISLLLNKENGDSDCAEAGMNKMLEIRKDQRCEDEVKMGSPTIDERDKEEGVGRLPVLEVMMKLLANVGEDDKTMSAADEGKEDGPSRSELQSEEDGEIKHMDVSSFTENEVDGGSSCFDDMDASPATKNDDDDIGDGFDEHVNVSFVTENDGDGGSSCDGDMDASPATKNDDDDIGDGFDEHVNVSQVGENNGDISDENSTTFQNMYIAGVLCESCGSVGGLCRDGRCSSKKVTDETLTSQPTDFAKNDKGIDAFNDAHQKTLSDEESHYTFQDSSFRDQLAMIQESPRSSGFKCRICKVRFTKDVLPLVHMRSHVQKDNYWCNMCKFKSSFKSVMLRHLESNHKVSHPRGAKKKLVYSTPDACGGRKNGLFNMLKRKVVDNLQKKKAGEKKRSLSLEASPSRSAKSWCHKEKVLLKSISSKDSVQFVKFSPLTKTAVRSRRKDHTPRRVDVDMDIADIDVVGDDECLMSVRDDGPDNDTHVDCEKDGSSESDLVMDFGGHTESQADVEPRLGDQRCEHEKDEVAAMVINTTPDVTSECASSIKHPSVEQMPEMIHEESTNSTSLVNKVTTIECESSIKHPSVVKLAEAARDSTSVVPNVPRTTEWESSLEHPSGEQVTLTTPAAAVTSTGKVNHHQSQDAQTEAIPLSVENLTFRAIVNGLCIQTKECAFLPSIEVQKFLLQICDPKSTLPKRCDNQSCRRAGKMTMFHLYQTLFNHMLYHGPDCPYQCKLCGYRSRSLTYFNNHMQQSHGPELSDQWQLPTIDFLIQLSTERSHKSVTCPAPPASGHTEIHRRPELQTSGSCHPKNAAVKSRHRQKDFQNVAAQPDNTSHRTEISRSPESQTSEKSQSWNTPDKSRHRQRYIHKVDYIYSPSCAEKRLYWKITDHQSKYPNINTIVQCEVCSIHYSMQIIPLHQRRAHEDSQPFSCCQCDLKCDTLGDIITHVKSHHELTREMCDVFHICNLQNQTYHEVYMKPSYSMLMGSQVYHCNGCKYSTFDLYKMQRHVQANHKVILGLEKNPFNGQYVCKVCDRLWSDRAEAVNHQCSIKGVLGQVNIGNQRSTNGEMRSSIICKFCPFSAKTEAAMRVHNVLVHQCEGSVTNQPTPSLDSAQVDQQETCNDLQLPISQMQSPNSQHSSTTKPSAQVQDKCHPGATRARDDLVFHRKRSKSIQQNLSVQIDQQGAADYLGSTNSQSQRSPDNQYSPTTQLSMQVDGYKGPSGKSTEMMSPPPMLSEHRTQSSDHSHNATSTHHDSSSHQTPQSVTTDKDLPSQNYQPVNSLLAYISQQAKTTQSIQQNRSPEQQSFSSRLSQLLAYRENVNEQYPRSSQVMLSTGRKLLKSPHVRDGQQHQATHSRTAPESSPHSQLSQTTQSQGDQLPATSASEQSTQPEYVQNKQAKPSLSWEDTRSPVCIPAVSIWPSDSQIHVSETSCSLPYQPVNGYQRMPHMPSELLPSKNSQSDHSGYVMPNGNPFIPAQMLSPEMVQQQQYLFPNVHTGNDTRNWNPMGSAGHMGTHNWNRLESAGQTNQQTSAAQFPSAYQVKDGVYLPHGLHLQQRRAWYYQQQQSRPYAMPQHHQTGASRMFVPNSSVPQSADSISDPGIRVPSNLVRFMNPSSPSTQTPAAKRHEAVDSNLTRILRETSTPIPNGMRGALMSDDRSSARPRSFDMASIMATNKSTGSGLHTDDDNQSLSSAARLDFREPSFASGMPLQQGGSNEQTIDQRTSKSDSRTPSQTLNRDGADTSVTGHLPNNANEVISKSPVGSGSHYVNVDSSDNDDDDDSLLDWMLHSPSADVPTIIPPKELNFDRQHLDMSVSSNERDQNQITQGLEDSLGHVARRDSSLNERAQNQITQGLEDSLGQDTRTDSSSSNQEQVPLEHESRAKPDDDESVESEAAPIVTRIVTMKNGLLTKVGIGRPC